jgi:hypothetical protein
VSGVWMPTLFSKAEARQPLIRRPKEFHRDSEHLNACRYQQAVILHLFMR